MNACTTVCRRATFDTRDPWTKATSGKSSEEQVPAYGGDSDAMVILSASEATLADKDAIRTASKTNNKSTTGANMGAGPGAGSTKSVGSR